MDGRICKIIGEFVNYNNLDDQYKTQAIGSILRKLSSDNIDKIIGKAFDENSSRG